MQIANDSESCTVLNQSRGWNRAMPAASRGVFVCAATAPSEVTTEQPKA